MPPPTSPESTKGRPPHRCSILLEKGMFWSSFTSSPPVLYPPGQTSRMTENTDETPLLRESRSSRTVSFQHGSSPSTDLRLVCLFSGLALVVFVGALDETIVAVAAVPIVSSFNAFSSFSWVTVSYLVTLISVQPIYGSVSNILGRKGPILLASSVFLLASAGCGWAPSMPFFIGARALSGVGAGGMTGLSFIIVADSFPIDERPKYQSILMSGFGVAAVLGPILGGVLSKQLTWRWCFWINLPIVVFAFSMVMFFYHDPNGEVNLPSPDTSASRRVIEALHRVDWIGSILFAAAIVCFVIPISLGGDYWPWNSPQVPVLLVLAILCSMAFIVNESYIDQGKALVPRRMMKNGRLLGAWATLLLYSVCFTSFLYYMPVWFQVVERLDAIMAGVFLLPFLFGQVGVGIIYALLLRLAARILFLAHVNVQNKRRPLSIIGAVLFLVGIMLVSTLADRIPIGALLAILLCFGTGSGLVLQSSFIEAQSAVSSDDVAMANSLAIVSEYLGGAIGLTISGTINRSSLTRSLDSIPVEVISPSLVEKILQNPTLVDSLSSSAKREIFRSAFQTSLLLTLKTLIGFAAAVFVISIYFLVASANGDGREEEDSNE